jgi:putative membrane protein insertion efficiency factor
MDTANPTPQPGFAARILWQLYKSLLSPVFHAFSNSQCIYLPTCSEYAYVALVRHGAMRGSSLALRRFLRCHPFAQGGFDPVPETTQNKGKKDAIGDSAATPSVSQPRNHLP